MNVVNQCLAAADAATTNSWLAVEGRGEQLILLEIVALL
jgi:hypothetical protein